MRTSRRNFLRTSALAVAALPLSTQVWGSPRPRKELFKISLAQWSLHRSIFAEKIDNLDFAVRRGKALSCGGCDPRPTPVAPVGSGLSV